MSSNAVPTKPPSKRRRPPLLDGSDLARAGLDRLREAIRSNSVSFPACAPAFEKRGHPELQWRFAVLYFVRGWNCRAIAAKYRVLPPLVRRILTIWRDRAVAEGYIQYIPPSLDL
jgi:hypothetical protein